MNSIDPRLKEAFLRQYSENDYNILMTVCKGNFNDFFKYKFQEKLDKELDNDKIEIKRSKI